VFGEGISHKTDNLFSEQMRYCFSVYFNLSLHAFYAVNSVAVYHVVSLLVEFTE